MGYLLKNFILALALTGLILLVLYFRVNFKSYNSGFELLWAFSIFIFTLKSLNPKYSLRTVTVFSKEKISYFWIKYLVLLSAITYAGVKYYILYPDSVETSNAFGFQFLDATFFLAFFTFYNSIFLNEQVRFKKDAVQFTLGGMDNEIQYQNIEKFDLDRELLILKTDHASYEIPLKRLSFDDVDEITRRFEKLKAAHLFKIKTPRKQIPYQHFFNTDFITVPGYWASDRVLDFGCLFIVLVMIVMGIAMIVW